MVSNQAENWWAYFFFILYLNSFSSSKKMNLQPWKEGVMCSKNLLFLEIQIAQDPRMMISMKKGLFSLSLRSWKASKTDKLCVLLGQMKPQHYAAKGQLQKRWCRVSSRGQFLTAQLYSSSSKFFLLSKFLVLTLSCSSIQKNTLCFGWHELFHIQEKWGGVCLKPISTLYALMDE